MGSPLDELTPKELAQLKAFIETYLRKTLSKSLFEDKKPNTDLSATKGATKSATRGATKNKNSVKSKGGVKLPNNMSILDGMRHYLKQPNSAIYHKLKKRLEQEVEKEASAPINWLEVIPYGLVGGMVPNLCIMVFKEKNGANSFAVPMSSMQAKLIINQGAKKGDPFRLIKELLRVFKVRVHECYLQQNKDGQVVTRLVVRDRDDSIIQSIQLPAGDVIPFAMYAGCSFYCTKQFIKSMLNQEIDVRMSDLSTKKPLYLN